MFTVRGKLKINPDGPIRTIAWDEGILIGDADAVEAAELAALETAQVAKVGPVGGPYYTGNTPLGDPRAAAVIVSSVFVLGTMVALGEIPERPPIPEGAIG